MNTKMRGIIERASPDIIIGSEGEVGEERKSVSGKEVMEEEKGGGQPHQSRYIGEYVNREMRGNSKSLKRVGSPPLI